ncbi:MAG: hypothetical protein S4CHLAM7_04900 [Chlamydiae bacterium]|nr:hypothetical protein [Chlamydiota bacterium]
MSLYWGPMNAAIKSSVSAVKTGLSTVQSAKSSMKLQATAKLQWDMAIMQQVLQASSNVVEGCLSTAKSAIGNMNR